jgi:aspartyl/glutamyl-tRNA(Asn/Gln) amidotransferase C subunit
MKYSQTDLELDALAASIKLSLSESEKQSFAKDICDMLNYCYENLFCESAEGTLELSLRSQRALDELRADEPSDLSCTAEILANAPALFENMIVVPKAVGSEGGNE